MRAKKGTLNVISEGFASIGETGGAREVYANTDLGIRLGKEAPYGRRRGGYLLLRGRYGHVTCPHEDTLVITTKIDGYHVKKVLIDSGISTNVLFLDTLKKMIKTENYLKKVNFSLM